ncbi:MAG: biotin/lipoyl-containing protein, partial [Dongiaceae bacterium]
EAVKYVGAGTVEFIRAESGEFYFMEMNTRLQVEHPVTEMIFGLDLVELQLRIAAGEKLPFSQKDLKPKGHAVEARLYAEDPRKNFLPAIGKLAHLVFPDNARIDTGVRAGDSITPFFDPMIAKIISHGKDRAAAIENLQKALAKVELAGLATNLEFLQHVIGHKEFKAGKLDTGFIARHEADLIPQPLPPSAKMLEAACHFLLQAGRPSPSKAWQKIRADATLRYFFWQGQKLTATSFAPSSDIKIRRIGDQLHLWEKGRHVVLDLHPDKKAAIAASGLITAPMPGKIIQLFVKQGDKVESGQPLLILEAMKMEHTLTAPHSGKVAKLFVKTSEQVNEGAELIEIDAKSG